MKDILRSLYHFLSSRFQTIHLDYPVKVRPRWGHGSPPHPLLNDIISKNHALYAGLLAEALSHRDEFLTIKRRGQETNPHLPTWNNGFFPGLDIIALYTLLGHFRPKRYVEVGSGNSTKVAALAIRELKLDTRITSIDPHPRAEIDTLAQEIIRMPFEDLNPESILSLEENDILFIDNSHRILPNSDAMVFFLEVLPRLKKGVVVHIHDIYLPYDYPHFMAQRYYSEQYGLAMYLLADPERYSPVFPSFFISEDAELKKILEPFWQHPSLAGVERHGGSFWLQIGR